MRNLLASAALLGFFSAVPAIAASIACPGTLLLQDAFTAPNPAWDLSVYPQNKFTIQGGKAETAFQQTSVARPEIFWGRHFGDVNVCVTLTDPPTDKAENQTAGLIFWASDYNSYFSFEIQQAVGQYAVAEWTPGTSGSSWTLPVAWTASPAIVKTLGSQNTLRVQTKGNTATLFINDQQVGTVTGTPPTGGGQVGFWVGSSTTSTSTWDVTNFSASSPQAASASSSPACPGTVVFQDPFANPDPFLNISVLPQSSATPQGGKLQMAFSQGGYWRALEYTGAQYGDVDVCATFTGSPTDKAENQLAGLIFWAADYSAFYVFEINSTTGQYELAQMSGSKWTIMIASAPSPAVQKGMGKTNTLRVQTKANAASLYVNNQLVETIYAAPPTGGGLVEFYAESESTMTAPETWTIAGLTVAIP